jgi:short-subunit dehydrogenase
MNSFRDRVVLITGAASGIGRQLALTLAREGARIAAVDLSREGLDRLTADLAGQDPLATAIVDVTDLSALRRATAALEGQLGPTDVLIANAGIGRETAALTFKAEDVNAQLHVNLIGVVNSIDAVLAGMRQRRRGHLVAISSLASFHGIPRMAGYCAIKAGVNALMDSLRVELRPLGIDCTTICPGWIRTPLTEPIGVPAHLMMRVEEAVDRMVAAIRARKRFVAFPASSVLQVRLLRHLPGGLGDWLAGRFLAQAARMKVPEG